MSKQEILLLLMVSTFVVSWVVGGVSLTKIAMEKRYPTKQFICSWIPYLQLFPIAKIIGINVGKLFFTLLSIGIVIVILDKTMISSIDSLGMNLIVSTIIYAFPSFYIWDKVAEKGGLDNHELLGYLTGLPITGVFAMPYIAWKGNW